MERGKKKEKPSLVLLDGLLLGLGTSPLERLEVTFVLKTSGGDETLNRRSLGVCLSGLGGDLTTVGDWSVGGYSFEV